MITQPTRAYLTAIMVVILAACSQPPTMPIENAISTGIALTQNAAENIEAAIATGIAETQTALPTFTPTPTTPPSATTTLTTEPSATASDTATPTSEPPTLTPSPSPSPTSQRTVIISDPTPAPPSSVILDAYRTIQTLASLNDSQYVDCELFVNSYDHLEGLPVSYDGIAEYTQARALVLETSRDEKQFCVAWLAGASTDNLIPFMQWGLSRQGTDDAVQILRPVIISLGYTP